MKNANGGDKAEIRVSAAVVIPESDELLIDARALKSFLVDVADGGTLGMRREQEGIADVIHEITTNQKAWGAKAGVTVDEVDVIVTTTAQLALLRTYRPGAAKLIEMLNETEAMLEDRRDTVIRTVASSVDAKSRVVGDEIVARYEKTRAYRSAAGDKAAKTRKKNAAQKAKPTPA